MMFYVPISGTVNLDGLDVLIKTQIAAAIAALPAAQPAPDTAALAAIDAKLTALSTPKLSEVVARLVTIEDKVDALGLQLTALSSAVAAAIAQLGGAPTPTPDPTPDPTPAPSGSPATGLLDYGKAQRPFSPLAKPAKGQRVDDPDFPGTKIVRITDCLADFKAKTAIPAYPTTQAWNCDETRFVLYVTGAQSGGRQGYAMFDGKTYAFIKFLAINPGDVEQFYWSHSDPTKLVYIDNRESGGSIIMKMMEINVETGTQVVLHDFMPDVKAQGWPTTGPVRAGYPFYSGGDLELWGLGAGGIPNVSGQLGLNAFGFNAKTGKVTRYTGIPVAQAHQY